VSEVIKTNELTKRFEKVTVVENLSITLKEKEIYGFLGLNGAGKTTTIRMLLGMITPTEGTATIFGEKVSPGSPIWSRIGYLVERPSAYPELTVRENLEVARRLHMVRDGSALDSVIEKLSLSEFENRRAGTLSTGNMQRLGLAKALINEPELLILDEPSNGLDPAGIVEIREMLLDMVRRGMTIFMSSHILSEVDRLATKIGIIHGGRLLEEIDSTDLEKRSKRTLVIKTRDNAAACRFLVSLGLDANLDGEITIRGQGAVDYPDRIATQLVNAGYPPMAMNIEQPDLETHFLQMVEGGAAQ